MGSGDTTLRQGVQVFLTQKVRLRGGASASGAPSCVLPGPVPLLEFTPISGLLPGGEQLCPILPLLPQSPASWTRMDDRDPESKALTHPGSLEPGVRALSPLLPLAGNSSWHHLPSQGISARPALGPALTYLGDRPCYVPRPAPRPRQTQNSICCQIPGLEIMRRIVPRR